MGKHWVPTVIDTSIKVVAVIVASYIQAFISAAYCGLRGGRMFAGGLFSIAAERGWLEELPDILVAKPFDADKSYLDEAIAFPVGALGFYMQVASGFGPVPLEPAAPASHVGGVLPALPSVHLSCVRGGRRQTLCVRPLPALPRLPVRPSHRAGPMCLGA